MKKQTHYSDVKFPWTNPTANGRCENVFDIFSLQVYCAIILSESGTLPPTCPPQISMLTAVRCKVLWFQCFLILGALLLGHMKRTTKVEYLLKRSSWQHPCRILKVFSSVSSSAGMGFCLFSFLFFFPICWTKSLHTDKNASMPHPNMEEFSNMGVFHYKEEAACSVQCHSHYCKFL